MIEKYMTGEHPRKQSEARKKANEDIKRICSKNQSNTETNHGPDVGKELAEAIFGRVFAGNPETGEVPGARPMTNKEFCQFAYKAIRRMVKDPEEFDKLFNLEALFGESSDD
jgi:hypothetical protein